METAHQEPARRRLTWPSLGAAAAEELPAECHTPVTAGGASPVSEEGGPSSPAPYSRQLPSRPSSGPFRHADDVADALLQSPTLGGIMLCGGRRRRRSPLTGGTAALCLFPVEQPGAEAAELAEPAGTAAAAATSSSRRSLQAALAAQQAALQQPAAASPATPAAAPGAGLPAAPRKRSLAPLQPAQQPAGRRYKAACCASRMLPGMAPASASELQAVRAWLSALEAQ